MNFKRFMLATIVLFIFIFAYETFVHGFLLKDLYQQTASIWRSYDQMMDYIPFNIAIMAITAIWISFIFTRFYKEGGRKNGLLFGFYIGVLTSIQAVGAYYFLPISATLAVYWFISYLVECVIGGFLIGLVYRR